MLDPLHLFIAAYLLPFAPLKLHSSYIEQLSAPLDCLMFLHVAFFLFLPFLLEIKKGVQGSWRVL